VRIGLLRLLQPRNGRTAAFIVAVGGNREHRRFAVKANFGPGFTGLLCVGLVDSDPDGQFVRGQKVAAVMGGIGWTINGSYAEFTQVPATNVVPMESDLYWEELAAIPESYATAWSQWKLVVRLCRRMFRPIVCQDPVRKKLERVVKHDRKKN
jgi:hypothetical protein